MKERKLRVLVDNRPNEVKAARTSIEDIIGLPIAKALEIEANTLAEEIELTYSTIIELLSQLPLIEKQFQVETITFTLGLDSTGKVSLLSALSGSVTTQMGLTFTLSTLGGKSDVKVSQA